jgi:hypothetical protein
VRVPRAALQRGMLPLRAVSGRAFTASRELDSILPKVYDIYLANTRLDTDKGSPLIRGHSAMCNRKLERDHRQRHASAHSCLQLPCFVQATAAVSVTCLLAACMFRVFIVGGSRALVQPELSRPQLSLVCRGAW